MRPLVRGLGNSLSVTLAFPLAAGPGLVPSSSTYSGLHLWLNSHSPGKWGTCGVLPTSLKPPLQGLLPGGAGFFPRTHDSFLLGPFHFCFGAKNIETQESL